MSKSGSWNNKPRRGSAKEATEEDTEDADMADDSTETNEAANEATEQQDDVEDDKQRQLMDYCLALEEEKEYLRSHYMLPLMFDSVLSKQEVDLGNICVETEELNRQFAAMATDDNDEGPLTGIDFNELYSFCTRQAARKSTD